MSEIDSAAKEHRRKEAAEEDRIKKRGGFLYRTKEDEESLFDEFEQEMRGKMRKKK